MPKEKRNLKDLTEHLVQTPHISDEEEESQRSTDHIQLCERLNKGKIEFNRCACIAEVFMYLSKKAGP